MRVAALTAGLALLLAAGTASAQAPASAPPPGASLPGARELQALWEQSPDAVREPMAESA